MRYRDLSGASQGDDVMRAAYYESFGKASDVLTIAEVEKPVPGEGEVLVRVHATAVNPSDVKLRAGARPGATMAFPRIVPHSDGAGVIEAVGQGVDEARIGERVWIYNGQWQRAFGTAAAFIVLPAEQAVHLPGSASFAEGACMGIPAMTAWYALFGDGTDLRDQTILVTGGAGTVGRYAIQMARLAGARVITTVSSKAKADHAGADDWINYREVDVADALRDLTGGAGIDRIVDVDFAANQSTALASLRQGGVMAAYASASEMKPMLDFYGFMFRNITLRMLIAYLIPDEDRRRGEAAIGAWLEAGSLTHAVVDGGNLDDIAAAHDRVAAGDKLGSVVLSL